MRQPQIPPGGAQQRLGGPAPNYRPDSADRHITVDLMDHEGTIKTFSELDSVTDLVYAAYVEKPTMAETFEPNARTLKNTLDGIAAHNVRFSTLCLRAAPSPTDSATVPSMPHAKETQPRLYRADPLSPAGRHYSRLGGEDTPNSRLIAA